VNNEISGDILIKYQDKLKPFLIDGALVPLLIDEIPILALLATQIDGISIIKSASELRVKESDRIKVTTEVLSLLNADVRELKDGLIISGKTRLKPQVVNTYNDHRISMMLKVARLICEDLIIINSDCDKISYPEFENDLRILMK
jgi:3-phosphoshikimate 1-carboxyvinyltransferase